MEASGDQVIIDTDILIDILKRVRRESGSWRSWRGEGRELSMTIINAFELYYGPKSRRK